MRFQDKVCLVTGGGSGIGQATCLKLAREGGRVVAIGRSEGNTTDTVTQITAAGGQAIAGIADVSVPIR